MSGLMDSDTIYVIRDPVIACSNVKFPANFVFSQGFLTPDGYCFANSAWGWNPFITGYFLDIFKTQCNGILKAWLAETHIKSLGNDHYDAKWGREMCEKQTAWKWKGQGVIEQA